MVALPNIRFVATKPFLEEYISVNRSADRIMQTVEYADPCWKIPMITKPLTNAERLTLEAFRQEAGNGMKTVLFTPKHICIPRAYWGDADNAILDNLGTLTSITGGDTLNIGSVTTGLVLSPGDLISLTTGAYNYIVQLITGATAVAGAISVRAGPVVPSFITNGAVVTFKHPVMNTRVIPGSFDIPDGPFPTASFTLQEVPL